MLTDSHCHLDFPDFDADRDAVVARAAAAGVSRLVTISTRVATFPQVRAIAERYEPVFCTVGTHPHQAHVEPDVSVEQIVALSAHPKCVGIGEAGLDYHYDRAPRDVAARVFRTHIAAARQSGLPLVIHARDADADMMAILREEMGQGAFKAVLHCFSSSAVLARTGLELDLFVSFSGILTFKGSTELRAIARDVPLDRLLVETDAPFLAPVPHRGRRNEPAYVGATCAVLAAIKGLDPQAMARIATLNTHRLFAKLPALVDQPITENARVA